jgi:DNA-binding NtrC family response regulator
MVQETLREFEKALLRLVLQDVQKNKSAAAWDLPMGYKVLYRQLKATHLG